eukprot:Blabericola_migrator_1__1486@NODE_1393_length_4632_cov_214_102957_g932_i0_p1_GENE_NODE_1393_length_4632_cov_214_102957_g932_i0NODE_1393_length_4632_cov_214_102957_g932_i0_p1_ORF_typecomplete_len702_score122_66Transketolase_N/PF00456_21/2_4e105Transketolase_N/PF00456_21/1_2e03Transket_pyr/PF02779_24/1_1e36Transketolase_C/PF02780_20/1_2e12DXP_synthase_N/PF13292_6/9_1e08E1_dh/PF00676_20/2_6e08XFP_C/PF09363_10/3e03XFP_C/PF09363_10/0_000893HCDH_RFF/PF18321_1/1_1e033HCDH_RFF/PF18321_1/0_62DJ1_PfpI/PF0
MATPNKRKASTDAGQPPAKKLESAAPVADFPTYINVDDKLAALCVNTIRCLAPALPQAAKSGHPGAPMGLAVVAYALWGSSTMRFSPKHPQWWDRDRFVLSNGHACALLYTMLHLTGYALSLDDLKNFRQIGSKTPGHPEANHSTPGVEVTTGPLGQGIAQAVGLAIAAANVAAEFNKPDLKLFTGKIYCILGDGCLQEGISSEACALAGHLKLSNLIAIYDDNHITIDGDTSLSFSEDVTQRFKAQDWDVIAVPDGHINLTGIIDAIKKAQRSKDRPTLIRVRTIIGYGAATQNTAKVHGAPVGEADLKELRKKCGFSEDMWDVPKEAYNHFTGKGKEGDVLAEEWNKQLATYKHKYPEDHAELERRFKRQLPADLESCLPSYKASDKADATRNLSEKVLNALRAKLPELVGGSADLMESNKTLIKGDQDFTATNHSGRRIRFGVREHAMVAITNGIYAYGFHIPFAATFLNFYTYAWGALRLSALSKFGIICIATHDSIDLGEDGPTHQPIETAALMRATPNLNFIRPCDGNEVSGAYAAALANLNVPTVMALSRGVCPHMEGTSIEHVKKGAYVLKPFSKGDKKRIVVAASGTEVQEAMAAYKLLTDDGYSVSVVSMPSWYLFELQSKEYQESVLPRDGKTLCVYIEALGNFGWSRYFDESLSCGMTTFGQSGPAAQLKQHFGITGKALYDKLKAKGI